MAENNEVLFKHCDLISKDKINKYIDETFPDRFKLIQWDEEIELSEEDAAEMLEQQEAKIRFEAEIFADVFIEKLDSYLKKEQKISLKKIFGGK